MANTILLKRSAVANAVPSTGNLSLGELALNTFDGKLYTKIDNGAVSVVDLTENQTITLSGNLTGSGTTSIVATLTTTGVTAGTYGGTDGSATNVGVFTVDPYGRITSASNVAISTSSIANGTSNVSIPVADGNINLSVGGNANVFVVTGTGANVTGTLGVSGNANVGNLGTAGQVVATGNVSGGNVVATANVVGGNVTTTGVVAASGNVSGDNIIATANVSGGNVTTTGIVSATGNVSGANLVATANVVAGNISTTGVLTASGNANVGNLGTAGLIVATGNISGGNLITGGLVQATGNVTGGNLITAGNIAGGNLTVSGNVDAGNVNAASGTVTADTIIATGNIDGANVNTNNLAGSNLTVVSTGNLTLTSSTEIVSVSGARIVDVSEPTLASDAATKQYVDDAVSTGIQIHTPVYVEAPVALPAATYAQGGTTATVTDTIAGNTVVFSSAINPQPNDQLWFSNSFQGIQANVPYFVVSAPNTSAAILSSTYSGIPVANITSGSGLTQSVRINSGQGATLTANANGQLTVDGIALSGGERVLVYNQATAYENGVYDVTVPGDAGNAWVLTRSSDMDTYIPDSIVGVDAGDYFFVEAGLTGAGESYVMTAPVGPVIIGYNALTFTQFSASSTYSANTQAGLTLTGTIFSAKIDNDTTAFDGNGNIIVKASANLVTPNIGDATGNSLTLTGNGALSATTVSATGNIAGGNLSGTLVTGTLTTNAQPNITSVGTLSSLSVTGNVSPGNIDTSGTIVATGNITGGNLLGVTNVYKAGVTVLNANDTIDGGSYN